MQPSKPKRVEEDAKLASMLDDERWRSAPESVGEERSMGVDFVPRRLRDEKLLSMEMLTQIGGREREGSAPAESRSIALISIEMDGGFDHDARDAPSIRCSCTPGWLEGDGFS